MKSDLVKVDVTRHGETDKAILVSDSGEKEDAVWVPKSQCEIFHECADDFITLTMPQWLAEDKGLF